MVVVVRRGALARRWTVSQKPDARSQGKTVGGVVATVAATAATVATVVRARISISSGPTIQNFDLIAVGVDGLRLREAAVSWWAERCMPVEADVLRRYVAETQVCRCMLCRSAEWIVQGGH